MNVIIIGAGYVGLVTATCLASKGNRVICVERNHIKINQLNVGIMPIYEPGLKALVQENMAKGLLSFASTLKQGLDEMPSEDIENRLLIYIAVGTPQGEDGSADLRYVLEVATEIGQKLKRKAFVINKSTVPVGTADLVRGEIAWQLFQRKEFIDFEVVSNPEFLKEGAALEDFFNPDRIVIGSESSESSIQLTTLYAPFVENLSKILVVGVKEAELIKYASNAMLATRISFMNEIAVVCDRLGVDVDQVQTGVGTDSRIGPFFLKAGCGYGGSCFPKDVQALVRVAQSVGVNPFVLSAVETRNKTQKQYLFEKIISRLGSNLSGRQFAVWGLAFKADTDDMREASSIDVVRALVNAGAKVIAHDPMAAESAGVILKDLLQTAALRIEMNAMTAASGADALLLLTEWDEYKNADFNAVKISLKFPLIFDGRNHLPMAEIKKLGFEYFGIGRG